MWLRKLLLLSPHPPLLQHTLFLQISHINKLKARFCIFSLLDFKLSGGLDERSELFKSVVSGIKAWLFLLDKSSDISEKCPTVFVREVIYRTCDECDFFWSEGIKTCRNIFGLFRLLFEDFDIDEFITSDDERIWGLFFSDTDNELTCFSKPCCEPREVAVWRDEAKSLHSLRVEDIHRIDDHRRVGSIFPGRITVLLYRSDGIF